MTAALPVSDVRTIADLITSALHVDAREPIANVARIWEAHPGVDGMAVLGEGHVLYLSRHRFLVQLGKRFGYSLFENRPVSLLSEEGSTVGADMDPVEVISLATQREPERIYDDILVLDEARFLGLVSMRSLLTHHKGLLVNGIAERAHLEEKNRQLHDLHRAHSELVATLVGELRSPVVTMLGLVRALKADAEVDRRHARTLDSLLARVHESVAIVSDLDDRQQLAAGGPVPFLESMSLIPLLDEAIKETRLLLGARTVRLTSDVGGAPASFPGDPLILRRILSNLLGGAVRRTAEGEIALVATQSGDDLLLSVHDTGREIPAAELERLVNCGKDASDSGGSGAGSGWRLVTLRGLVEAARGTVDATSSPRAGSVVTVRFSPT